MDLALVVSDIFSLIEIPADVKEILTDTTRSPRQGESQGVSYHYVERSEFEKLIEEGAFLEHAQFGGNYYGTSAKAVEEVSKPDDKGRRRRALLDIDTQVRERKFSVKRLMRWGQLILCYL